jgi:hypothetical protein
MNREKVTIWKFPLEVTDVQEIELPYHSRCLDLQVQDGVPCLWALVCPDEIKLKRKVSIYGTGHDVPKGLLYGHYLGTFQLHDGDLVFHAFLDGADETLLLREALKSQEIQ